MAETATAQEPQAEPAVPVSFRLSTYWKLGRDQAGVTHVDSRRIALSEVLDLALQQLSEDECTSETAGEVTTIVIDWAKVPQEIRNPFAFGVRR
jgi:hypothetical protein